MSIFSKMKTYLRFATDLRNFLRYKLSLEEARKIVRQRIEEREANFLKLIEKSIFGYSLSPYLPLLKLADCEMGDIQKMVRNRGLEETLRALREAGVYFSFEEYKGLEPTVRDGKLISVQPRDFDNPYLHSYYHGQTGGTTGSPTRVMIGLDHLAAQAPFTMLAHEAHGLLDVPTAIWLSGFPESAALNNILRPAKFGQTPEKWFSDTIARERGISLIGRMAPAFLLLMGYLSGNPIPWPKLVRLDEAIVIAHWAIRNVNTHGGCLIYTFVSRALRICIAAQEEGLDMTGVSFVVAGEPPTPAKVKGITSTGARCVPRYAFTEHGTVGIGCALPIDENDIHLSKDALALIQFPRQVPGSEITVDAFNFTSLLPTAPKLLLNVESDDYGVVEDRSCGCPLGDYNFTTHLRNIRSFRKLTGAGPTLIGPDMVHILEEILPVRFGGSPLDYQLIEEENEDGFTRFNLVVSPKVEILDETAVIEVVLDALGSWKRSEYRQAELLRVRRMEPILTPRGKLLSIIPLHMARRFKIS
ncbi:hypothetical protein ACFL1Z_01885 [Thermodesulfobacteriota bacterium]